jgi:WD40 repeat protein
MDVEQGSKAEDGAQQGAGEEDEDEGVADDAVIPMPGRELITVDAAVVGTGEVALRDGVVKAMFGYFMAAMLFLPDGCVLVTDTVNHRIRVLSGDLQQVSTVAGDGDEGHRDGAAAQARFNWPSGLALLPDSRVLVADFSNHRIRLLSADLQQVSTAAGGGERGHRDGAVAQARFNCPTGLALLPDGRVLVTDSGNYRIRVLSADQQQVSTAAGGGERGHRDGAVAQSQFENPTGLALLPDGRVLVTDSGNHRIRMLSADLQQVSTVAGDGEEGHRDGAAAQARFNCPRVLALLADGRVLVVDTENQCIRVLSADLQQVSTLTNVVGQNDPNSFMLLPDGRLLVADSRRIRVLEGFPATLLGIKPSRKAPKKK